MRIFLATWLFEPEQGKALTRVHGLRRLLSFYHTREKQEQFAVYSQTGRNDEDILSRRNDRNQRKG
jgi:hypothetical protein